MKAIETPYTERIRKPVFNPVVENHNDNSSEIMRIVQEEELTRMAGDDWKKRESCKMASWIKR